MTAALIARRAAEAAPLFRSNRSPGDGARRIGRYLVTHSLRRFFFLFWVSPRRQPPTGWTIKESVYLCTHPGPLRCPWYQLLLLLRWRRRVTGRRFRVPLVAAQFPFSLARVRSLLIEICAADLTSPARIRSFFLRGGLLISQRIQWREQIFIRIAHIMCRKKARGGLQRMDRWARVWFVSGKGLLTKCWVFKLTQMHLRNLLWIFLFV